MEDRPWYTPDPLDAAPLRGSLATLGWKGTYTRDDPDGGLRPCASQAISAGLLAPLSLSGSHKLNLCSAVSL